MMIIISPEKTVAQETSLVNSFFENGLDFFHVRKYEFSAFQMQNYLKQIDENFRSRLVLHLHCDLAEVFGINRLHFREQERLTKSYTVCQKYKRSTSVHCIQDFNALEGLWDYAFLSPVFPSISKSGYGKTPTVLKDLKHRNNSSVRLIGLGGIQAANVRQVMENGADGIALLGSVWQSDNPLKNFLACREIVQSY